MKQLLLLTGLFAFAQTAICQTAYTWNGSVSTAWNIPANWSPNGIPSNMDNVTIVTGGNVCFLNAGSSINNLIVTSGTLDLGGFTLSTTGPVATFTKGIVQNGTINVSAATSTTFGNGPMTMNCIVNVVSASVTFRNTSFQNTTTITKTGAGNDASSGNNVFNGTTSITGAGTGYLMLGNGNPDTFNGPVTFNNTGSSNLYVAHNSVNNVFGGITTFNNAPAANTFIYVSWLSAGTAFNNDVVVSSSGGQGVQFCGGNGTASATLAAGESIQIGAGGFSAGTLLLRQFIQTGPTAQLINLTGTAILTYGPASSFGGDITSSSPGLLLNGATFNGMSDLTKTGSTGDNSAGGNIFDGACSISNSGSSFLRLGNSNPDTWNSDVSFYSSGSSYIAPGWNTAGNMFNGNITVSSTGSSTGIQFGQNAASAANLAAGKTLLVGPAGFSSGTLMLKRFTQLGSAAINLNLTGATTLIQVGPSSALGGDFTVTSPRILVNGAVYNGQASLTKTGATGEWSSGGNIFNSTLTVNQTGAGYFGFANGSPDIYNGDVYANNNSTERIIFGNNPVGNQFNGNIILTQTGSSVGIAFGWSATTSETLAAGKTISIGAAGFTTGYLQIERFTQLGNAPIDLPLTGTSSLTFGPSSSIGGNLTSKSASLFFNGSTFNGMANCTKTGTSNDQSQGNNVFNGAATFTDNGTGYLLMTATNPDAYNGDVVFMQNNTGRMYPNYNANCSYAGNVTVTSPAALAITFGSNSGTATFSGTGAQSISATGGTPVPVFTRLVIANTGSGVTLGNSSINVSKNLNLTSGLLNTSTSFLLTMLNGSTTASGTALSTSYVNGPMRYQKSTAGASTLNFPIGNGADCRPVALTVSHTLGNLYTYQAQLFNASAAALGYTFPATVDVVSAVHYYTISRVNAASVSQPSLELSGNQTIQLFFGSNDAVSNGGTLTIVKNTFSNLTKWIDIGGTGGPAFTGNPNLSGSITSTSLPAAFNSFSTFAMADGFGGGNILPIDLLYFKAKPVNGQVDLAWATATESHNSHFTIEKSKDAANFDFVRDVNTQAVGGNSSVELDYTSLDTDPYSGISYYRLKQTDQDGNYSYSKIVSVNFAKTQVPSIYPNPSSGVLFISGLGTTGNNLKVEWYDAGGRNLLQQAVPVENGIARLNPPFSSGIYVLRFMTADGIMTVRQIIISK